MLIGDRNGQIIVDCRRRTVLYIVDRQHALFVDLQISFIAERIVDYIYWHDIKVGYGHLEQRS